jgi:hypothetical protein
MIETMKVYVTARFKGRENKTEIDELCSAVRAAGMTDVCFVRDVEHYKHTFDDPKDLWARVYDEINSCEALLIDVSDHPTGGRVVEVGMAFAMKKRIFVVRRQGTEYKQLFDGISSTVIEYETHKDITKELKKYYEDSNFNVTDKAMTFGLMLFFGGVIAWVLGKIFLPLGIIGAIIYWLIMRWIFKPLRAFDRIVIYIPLIALWLGGISFLIPIHQLLAFTWAITFWLVALFIIKKLKFSL